MTLLLTNDDGVDSPGIMLLAEALRKEGRRAFVLAPDRNRSGISHAFAALHGPVRIDEQGTDTWSCSGNPVDCVMIGLLGGLPGLENKPDMVISGINRGANLGTDLIYSGTAAAARQAALMGVPALSLSLLEADTYYWDMAVSFTLRRLEEFKETWRPDTFVNINIPNGPGEPREIVSAFPSRRIYGDSLVSFNAPLGGRYCFIKPERMDTDAAGAAGGESGSDWDVVSRNCASRSLIFLHPVTLDRGM